MDWKLIMDWSSFPRQDLDIPHDEDQAPDPILAFILVAILISDSPYARTWTRTGTRTRTRT